MSISAWPSLSSATPSGAPSAGETGTNVGKKAMPPPPPAKPMARLRLNSLSDVAKEVRKLYRESRAGTLALSDATKLAYLLNMLAGILTASDLEERLAKLETEKPKR